VETVHWEETMTIFGKPISEYVRFQKFMLAVVAAVGLSRLLLSLLSANNIAAWFSMTVLVLVGVVLYPFLVHIKKFGGYRHVLVLLSLQLVLTGLIIVLGIGIAVLTGSGNIFSGEDVGPIGAEVGHAAQHLIGGPIIVALILWIPSSVILFLTRLVAQRSA
jgi:hypothetical protein